MAQLLLGFSGGKDSLAVGLLLKEQGLDFSAVFADTGNEHPLTIEYIQWVSDNVFPVTTIKQDFTEEIEHKRAMLPAKWEKKGVNPALIKQALDYLKPTGIPFLDLCLWKMFPNSRSRFCSYQLKVRPMYEQLILPLLEAGNDVVNLTGIRKEESKARADTPEYTLENTLSLQDGAEVTHIISNPIRDWGWEEVFQIAEKYGIRSNPLYKQGSSRVGCYPCIYANKADLREMTLRYPEEIERIAEWEKLVAKVQNAEAHFFKPTAYWNNLEEKIQWSKTTHGGKELDPDLPEGDDIHACTSRYGLCK